MRNFVVTISREYGTGGHDIGKRLASLLDVPFYDREVVELTARKYALDEERLHEMEEQSRMPQPFGRGGGLGAFADSDDRLFILQSQTVIELAEEPCVIVGRCADFVLREHPERYSFFLYSGAKQRMVHVARHASSYLSGDPAQTVAKMDRRRAAYYKYHTGQEWGKPSNYTLCVDTGILGPKTAELLAEFVRLRRNLEGGAGA